MNRTQQALDYLRANPAATIYSAAKAHKINPSVLYRALAVKRCPACGAKLKGKP